MYEVSKYTKFKEMLDGRVKTFIQRFMLEFLVKDQIKNIEEK